MESARLRVAVLASGSKGNAALIEFGDTSILLDCGLGVAQLKKRLSLIGRSPTDITAMLVTHEHGDHCAGAAAVSSRFGLPVWMTPGTAEALNGKQFARTVRFNCHANIQIGELVIEPIPVPHDAREPCQFLFRAHDRRVAWLTDLGHVSAHVARVAAGCNGLLLEFNHDPDMLKNGPYPAFLRRRVAGPYGHLSNAQSGELLRQIDCSRLDALVALHLSEVNNCSDRVRAVIDESLAGSRTQVEVGSQHDVLRWLEF